MESTTATIHENNRGYDDTVFVSCAAMFTFAVMFLSGVVGNPITISPFLFADMIGQGQASVTETFVPVVHRKPTIEQELSIIGSSLDIPQNN
jgi:hypothetical protein